MNNLYHDEFERRRMQLLKQNMYQEAVYANRKLNKEEQMHEIKIDFNNIVLREFKLGLDDYDHLYDKETDSIYQISERYIKYSEDMVPMLHVNEIDFNVIENPRLMEILFGMWVSKWEQRNGTKVTSYYQSAIRGSKKGFFVLTYLVDGATKEFKSDVFVNESMRIFNLVCKLNHTDHLYDRDILNRLDIEIIRKGQK